MADLFVGRGTTGIFDLQFLICDLGVTHLQFAICELLFTILLNDFSLCAIARN
jgi:hypothetical protein